MSALDIDKLLAPLSVDEPSGKVLDNDLWELDTLAKGKPERQMGDEVQPAEAPNWRAVREQALGLLQHSKDLRAVIHLARAEIRTRGLLGLSDTLTLMSGLIAQHWDSVHPQLDPEDPEEPNDPTQRLNILRSLADPQTIVRAVREAPLVNARGLGTFAFRDIEIASGKVAGDAGTAPSLAEISAAFNAADKAELESTAKAVSNSRITLEGLNQQLNERVGYDRTPDFSNLSKQLQAIGVVFSTYMPSPTNAPTAPESEAGTGEGVGPVVSAASPRASGPIASREDAVRLLEEICSYFERHEPSSPVPLLLRRAKGLISKDFMDIIEDLAPNGLSQVELIRGSEGKGKRK